MSIDEIPSEAKLPTQYGDFNIRVFHESESGFDHVALSLGDMSGPDPVLMRVHSECPVSYTHLTLPTIYSV